MAIEVTRRPARVGTALLFALTALCAGTATAQGSPTVEGLAVVDDATRKSVERGLAWLASNQAQDGSWQNAGGYGTYPVAMTGLAGMAMLAGGSTPTRGRYWQCVRRAVDYLLRRSDPNTGCLSVGPGEHHAMYGHGFATLFLASVYGMEEDRDRTRQLKRVLDRAVELIANAQSADGGWYYTPDANTDEGSVTVTQIQALRACHMAGIKVDKKVIDKAVAYIRGCQNPDGGICYRLSMRGSQSCVAISAAGVAVLYNAGVYDDQPFVDKAVQFCKSKLSVEVENTGFHLYAHLYWSQALYQRGGDDWVDYYRRATKWLGGRQRADGSWAGDGVGPVYGTAIALTMLQLPQALVPILQR